MAKHDQLDPRKNARGPWPPYEPKHDEHGETVQPPPLLRTGIHGDPWLTQGASSPSPGDTAHIDQGY